MAPSTKAALIAIAALALTACPTPEPLTFKLENLASGSPVPPARILVGRHVVARLQAGTRPGPTGELSIAVDVFPSGAVVRNAWVRLAAKGAVVCEGPAGVIPIHPPSRFVIHGWRGEKPCQEKAGRPNRMTVFLGPVCVAAGCDTFQLEDEDWPPPRPEP